MAQTEAAPREVHVLLADGATVSVRPVRPDDLAEVAAFYDAMSPENLRLRFFTANRRSAEQSAERVCRPACPGRRALLAEAGGKAVGLVEYERLPGTDHADLALAVADRWHHKGVGTVLLEHAASAARSDGVTAFAADALSENRDVLKVFADLGLSIMRRFEGPEVHCLVRLEADETYLAAVEARGRTADVASLQPLLRPRSVAVVGPGRRPGSVGRAILHNLRRDGFDGRLYAVHPVATAVLGVTTYRTVSDVPQALDLAILAVPATAVQTVADECGRNGVRALLVVSAGLDREQGRGLLSACRRYGMRLVGPNCLGLANTEDDVRLDASFAADLPSPGTAGVAVQSGGVGIALLAGLSRLGIGVSTFVSLGDKYDVSGNDMLQWWESDGRTDLALLHLESFGNARAFSRTARRVTRTIPVLTVDAGRTAAGRRAAASHTAAAATPTMTRQALFRQAGVTAARSIAELLDTAALLHSQPLPAGRRVAVVSNAGGTGVLAADAAIESGLRVPPLSPELTGRLLATLPGGAAAANPVDTTAAVSEDKLSDCLAELIGSDEVDALIVALVPTAVATATGDDLTRSVVRTAELHRFPIAAVLPDQAPSVRYLNGQDAAVPAYADPQSAAHALAHGVDRTEWLARPQGTVADLDGIDLERASVMVSSYLSDHPDGGWADPRTCADLLGCYGIPQIPWVWARSESDAVHAARRFRELHAGAVLKAYWPGLVHKSEEHAVRLDLTDDAEVSTGYQDFAERFRGKLAGVLVQPMARRGVELFVGVVQDAVFGPLVMFGLGGTATEVLADHAARLAPLTDQDVHDLVSAPRCAPLLFGHRGAEPVDLEGLGQMLSRLSRMASDLPQLAEADLNPVIARPDGIDIVDVRLRLVPSRAYDPYLRRLR
ncbi:bifunctional GNAT family N-acetyltransferase/acetate--CoA ligase family protein [Streptomyces yangpuensis]|uniref:Bifunctional GNAT family N-acetyltransferase/acetate--CoA ligase family protein n=1 Tax=Streptomyces yangpuensis TaxID=1648182 RepID=A0ABY5PRF4_9ACTN|nr:bifunctional GNAT family N-acetyltransferase/acetate--CoA ligase family protein [Streptomyces yangpuensis]MBZ9594006.1 bifunctional GNAT family N-acetyltransferase/acetate--CoA ligase family protein [Streptomyces erythrochromogenes]UUY46040.1 bifunctional GNAT family N-acetyltransferase/acetate--CoA ligase family protein [Streptomyces yangpuensis]